MKADVQALRDELARAVEAERDDLVLQALHVGCGAAAIDDIERRRLRPVDDRADDEGRS